ncbi:MAG: glycosyltransferase family 2 protein [Bacteroidota bacterium]
MSKNSPIASVIIRCFNEEKHIGKLLTGIQQQTLDEVEIILVDSGSTDATLSIARQFPVQIVTIKPENFSFGRALNIGCQTANGQFLVFASAHVYPTYDDWLEKLIQPFEDPKVALTYGKQRGNGSTKFSEHQIFKRWFPNEANLHQKTPFCNNANAAIRRKLWLEQPYDEQLTGLEDLDWARKIIDQEYYLAYAADAEIIHVHEETARQTMMRYYREALAMSEMYPDQKFSLLDLLRLWIQNTLHDFQAAIRQHRFLRNLWSIPQFRLMQFWGTWRGYNQSTQLPEQLKRRFYYPPEASSRSVKKNESRDSRRIQYDQLTDV